MRRQEKQKVGMRIRTIARWVLWGAFGSACLVFLVFTIKHRTALVERACNLVSPRSVVCSFDHLYSATLRKELQEFIDRSTASSRLSGFNCKKFCADCRAQFPFIKRATSDRSNPAQLALFVQGVRPCLRLSDGRVLANKLTIFDASLFDEFNVQKLPVVNIAPEYVQQKIDAQVYRFLQSIPYEYWNKYQITYNSPHEIYLSRRSPIGTKADAFVVDQDSLFDHKKLEQCERLREHFCASTVAKQKKKKHATWVFDMRFADRIFIRQEKGGGQ